MKRLILVGFASAVGLAVGWPASAFAVDDAEKCESYKLRHTGKHKMLKRIMVVSGAVLAMCVVASTAMGADGEPKKANTYKATGVNGYDECTAPSELTAGSLPLPACPAVDSDTTCQFEDGRGRAIFALKAKDDLYLKIKVSHLIGGSCDGTTLQARATIQVTTNDCTVSSRCSTVTLTNFELPGATCVVAKGKCQIKTSLNVAAPGTITLGTNTAIRIASVSLGIPSSTASIVTAGVLVP